ncbi:MAG: RIP metalloprotease RseP [Acidobacteria bacterium]|nr:RIP metalloprotease RseP [Acidobacteriota bacterium]
MDNIIGFFQNILPFLFVIGVLIFVHELGHFLVARWYGVKVLAFSLGFGPKLLKVTRGDTEYCISAIPLGGYVKMAGETAEDTPSGDPTEFLSQSKWVRFQVYLAGPLMNVALALVLTTVVLLQGADVPLYRTAPPVLGVVVADGAGAKAGLQVGDRIVRVDDQATDTWDEFDMAVVTKASREVALVVQREGTYLDMTVFPDASGYFDFGDLGVLPVLRPQISQVEPGRPAAQAGMRTGDVLLAIAGERGLAQPEIIALIQKSTDTPLVFTVERAGAPIDLNIVPESNGSVAVIGVSIAPWETRRIDPNFQTAVQMSAAQTWEGSQQIFSTLAGLFTRSTPMTGVIGPVGIAQISGATAQLGWLPLLALMSMISLNLGVLNLMPIPVLDGGHITILAMEGMARRDFSLKVKERILFAGFALILMLMVTVIYNDVARLIR